MKKGLPQNNLASRVNKKKKKVSVCLLAMRGWALGEMGTYSCQNEMQRLPRLDFFNEFSDAMKSFILSLAPDILPYTQTNQRDDIFTLVMCCHEPKSTSLTTYASCFLLDNGAHKFHTGKA